jgi:hypothetical protein
MAAQVEECLALHTQRPAVDSRRSPGELIVDHELIERAVQELERIHVEAGLQQMVAIGRCLLGHFFQEDLSVYRARHRRHISYRRLAQRDDIPFSPSKLRVSVAILEQLEQLPRSIGWSLSTSHHRALLPVRDPGTKLELARQAVQDGMSHRQLERAVAARCPRSSADNKVGRPRLPEIVKQLRRISKIVAEPEHEDHDPAQLTENFSPEELAAIKACMEAHLQLVNQAICQQQGSVGS